MIDFRQNIDLLEKMVFRFITTEDHSEFIKSSNTQYLSSTEMFGLVQPSFFHSQSLNIIFKTAKKFFYEYEKIPNEKELWQTLQLENHEITKEEFDSAFSVSLSDYKYDFLWEHVKAFLLLRNLNVSVVEMLAYLKTIEVNPDNINDVSNRVRTMINDRLSINFDSTRRGLNFKDPNCHIQIAKDGIPTGYKFFDKVLGGGWTPKSLIVFQGRPKVGKTTVLASLGTRSFLSGVNVGIATLELSESKYMKKVGSNILSIPQKTYNTFTEAKQLQEVSDRLKALADSGKMVGELIIAEFPTGTPTAIDIENYFLREERRLNKKFQLIIVDYLNLMRPIKDQAGLYEKIKNISEELRAIAMRNNWCIISATQIKREAVDNKNPGMEAVAESFGLVHTVDGLFALIRPPLDNKMKIKVVANRDEGYEESYKLFRMVYEYARIQEEEGEGSEYYSDDDEINKMEQELVKEYDDKKNNPSTGSQLSISDYDDLLKNL